MVKVPDVILIVINGCFIHFVGKVIIHALDENAREYYNLEDLWTTETPEKEPIQVLGCYN